MIYMAKGYVRFRVREFEKEVIEDGADLDEFKENILNRLQELDLDTEILDRVDITGVSDFEPDQEDEEAD